MELIFRVDDEEIAVAVQPDGADWSLRLDEREVPIQVRPDSDGSWLVETHQGRRRLWVAKRGDERFVFCDGRTHVLRLVDPERTDEEDEAAVGPNLAADMPGKIVQVLVAVGAEVVSGQPLLIMESMKMETEVAAGVTGTVAAVHVAAGQVVGQGDALVDITPGE